MRAFRALAVGALFMLAGGFDSAYASPPVRVWYSEPYGAWYANGQGPIYATAQQGCAHFDSPGRYTFKYNPDPTRAYNCVPYYNGVPRPDIGPNYSTGQRDLCFDPVRGTYSFWQPKPNVSLADQCPDPPLETAQSCHVGNPVSPLTGQKIQAEPPDFQSSGPHPLVFQRTYRSDTGTNGIIAGSIGSTWFHNWQRALNIQLSAQGIIMARRADASFVQFVPNGQQWVQADGQSRDYITTGPNERGVGVWQYHVATTDAVEAYDADGRLLTVTERNGWTTTLTYSTVPTESIPWGGAGVLERVQNQFGARLSFVYNGKNQLIGLTTSDGRTIQYAIAVDKTITVTWPDQTVRRYHYEQDNGSPFNSLPGRVTGITDELGVRYSKYNYSPDTGFVTSEEHAGGVDKLFFSYGSNATTVTDGSGATRTFNYQLAGKLRQPTGASGSSPIGDPFNTIQYDVGNNVSRTVDRNGNDTRYSYDALGRETQRIEGYGTADAKTTTTEWHPTWNLPLRIASPDRMDGFTYDANGQTTSYVTYATSDHTGALGFGAVQAGQSTGMRWEYDVSGLVVAAIDIAENAESAKWTYTYDAAGNLATLTNPQGQIGRALSYDNAGRLLTAIDTSGRQIDIQYNSRGNMTRYQRGTDVVAYGYNRMGFLTTVSGPGSFRYELEYDDAHRLVAYWFPADLTTESLTSLSENPFALSGKAAGSNQRTKANASWLSSIWSRIQRWFGSLFADAHAQSGTTLVRNPVNPGRGQSGPGMAPRPAPADVLEQGNGEKQRPETWLARLGSQLGAAGIRMVRHVGGTFIGAARLLSCDMNGGDDDDCERQRDQDESNCRGTVRGRYGSAGTAICMKSAADRYGECLRFGTGGIRTPLAGLETPL